MKFTKQEAVEKLNHMLTNDGKKPLRMSARTLDGQTEALMSLIGNDEMELDDFVEKVKLMFETTNSNIEHDVSDSIKKYEQDHPRVEPKTDPSNPDNPNKELLDRLAKLEQMEEERTRSATIETKKSEIRKFLADNHVKDKSWVDMALGLTGVGADDDAEAKGKSILDLYNKTLGGGRPIPPGAPAPGDGNQPGAFDELKQLRKQRAENLQ